jgi:cell division protein FtsN
MKFKDKINQIIIDERAQGESNSIFFLIVVAIIAVVLIAVVKPMFNKSVKTSAQKANLPNQEVTNNTINN